MPQVYNTSLAKRVGFRTFDVYRTAKPRPRPYCQNGIPPALQTTDDPTGQLPEQSEKVLSRQWIRAAVMETISP